MGFHVSQLRSAPIGIYEYYVYFIDAAPQESHTRAIAESLLSLAMDAGTDAAIVSGPASLSAELTEFLQRHAPEHFVQLEILLGQVSCLLISRGALQTTTQEIFVVPLALGHTDVESQKALIEGLLSPLVQAMREDTVADFCRSLGAQELPLSDLKGGIVVAIFRNLNKVLELKPNVIGLGVNLNAVLERFLGPPERA